MPCDYKEYHPKWKLISKLIRVNRAKNHCEWCKVKNYAIVKRLKDGRYFYTIASEMQAYNNLVINKGFSQQTALQKLGYTKVVLTVAHIDHDKTNNKFSNLAALCQSCHLKHDIKQHVANRKYGRGHKGEHQLKLGL
jgi:hypothetical protein